MAVQELPDLEVAGAAGGDAATAAPRRLRDYLGDGPLVVVFVRHFG